MSRILLIKTKDIGKINNPINFHLRKLGNGGYSSFKIVCLVNKENQLVGMVKTNGFQVCSSQVLKENYTKEQFELTPKKWDKFLNSDDLLLLISLLILKN